MLIKRYYIATGERRVRAVLGDPRIFAPPNEIIKKCRKAHIYVGRRGDCSHFSWPFIMPS